LSQPLRLLAGSGPKAPDDRATVDCLREVPPFRSAIAVDAAEGAPDEPGPDLVEVVAQDDLEARDDRQLAVSVALAAEHAEVARIQIHVRHLERRKLRAPKAGQESRRHEGVVPDAARRTILGERLEQMLLLG